MRRKDIEALLARGWREAERAENAYWRSRTPAEALRITDDLRRSARSLRSDWPSPEEREQDLARHIRVAELLRRAEANRQR